MSGWSLDNRRPMLGTWALITLLVVVHVGTGVLWALQHDASVVDALLFDRSARFRMDVGGQHRVPLFQGQYWRLLTSVFLHGDALHLGINAGSLYALGRLLEPTLGTLRWLGWFVVGGTIASFVCWQVGVVRSDGASGGAFALLAAGVWLGWRHAHRWAPEDRRLMGPVLGAFLVANLVLSWVIPGIDAVAHMAGGIVGVGLAALDPIRSQARRPVYAVVLLAAAGTILWAAVSAT